MVAGEPITSWRSHGLCDIDVGLRLYVTRSIGPRALITSFGDHTGIM